MQKSTPKTRSLNVLKAEIEAIKRIKNILGKNFFDIASIISKREGNIVTTGVGKSGFIAMKASATLTSLGQRSFFLSPLDALHGDLGIIGDGDILILYSHSGETEELVRILNHLKKEYEITTIVITGNAKSKLAKFADKKIVYKITEEGDAHNVAPMSSTTVALVISDMLAATLLEPKLFKKEHFARLHPGGNLGLSLGRVEKVMVSGDLIPKVYLSDSLLDALKEMTRGKRGVSAVIDKKQKLVGVITDGDVRRALLNTENARGLLARDVMSCDPKTITRSSTLKEAVAKMEEHKITSLFVISIKGKLEGLIHIRHIMKDIT